MVIGENPRKIDNIVAGNLPGFARLYAPVMQVRVVNGLSAVSVPACGMFVTFSQSAWHRHCPYAVCKCELWYRHSASERRSPAAKLCSDSAVDCSSLQFNSVAFHSCDVCRRVVGRW